MKIQQSDIFLTRVIYGGGITLAIFLVLIGWLSLRVHKASKASIEKTILVEGNLAQALYLDMVLSGFARTALTRGELRWTERYEAIEQKLQEVLNELLSVLPSDDKEDFVAQTKKVSANLRGKEKEVFALLQAGKRKQASDLLLSETYDAERDVFYQILGQLGKLLKKYEVSLIQKGQRELYRSIFVLVIAFPTLFVSGFTFYRLLKRWQTALRNSNEELTVLNESLHHLAERLEGMAITDELTQLYNRRFAYQKLGEVIELAKRYDQKFSILLIDLDHFKKVNDTFGHKSGDLALKDVADRIKANLRQTDVACRFGGEEFMVILPQTGADDALTFAERVRQDIAGTSIKIENGLELHVTLSIGVSQHVSGDKADSLIARSDSALYRAKEKGRNMCMFQS